MCREFHYQCCNWIFALLLNSGIGGLVVGVCVCVIAHLLNHGCACIGLVVLGEISLPMLEFD
jgi:hypothetical protein